jgi:hypothetical protein
MKSPAEVEFLEDIRVLIYRPRGLLNQNSINKIITVIDNLEALTEEPFNRFFDGLGLTEVELNFRYMIHASLYRRQSYSGRPEVKSAILARHKTLVHYAKLHALLTEGSSIKARIFDQAEEAARWLDVPVERLIPDGSERGSL